MGHSHIGSDIGLCAHRSAPMLEMDDDIGSDICLCGPMSAPMLEMDDIT